MATVNTRQQTLTFFGTRILNEVGRDPILGRLLTNASLFVRPKGAYKPGQSIDIDVTKAGSVTIKTDFSTNSALSRTKSVFDRYTLSLTALAHTSLYWDMIDNAFSSANIQNGRAVTAEALIAQKIIDFVDAIETDLYTRTFNIASLDANRKGTAGQALTINDVIKIERDVTLAGWKGNFSVVLSPEMLSQFKIDNKGAYTNFTQSENAIVTRNGFKIDAFPKITFYESTNLPTSDDLTNITGIGTNKVGFIIGDDTTALFNPRIDVPEAINYRNTFVNVGNYNALITESGNADKELLEASLDMRALYGSVVYKPSYVFPLLGGNIT